MICKKGDSFSNWSTGSQKEPYIYGTGFAQIRLNSGSDPEIGQWGKAPNVMSPVVCWKQLEKPEPESTTVDSCNDENGIVEMKVTLRGHTGTYEGIDANGQGTFDASQLTKRFEGDNLILEKVFGGDECTKIQVDGVEVCSAVAEKITVQCKYSLAEQTLDEAPFKVTGQDTEALAENTGTLKYNLEVDNDKKIGEEITFRITPVNSGLVFATVKSCDVTKGNEKLTIIGHGADHCTMSIVDATALTDNFSSQNVIEGKWTAFKWSTTAENNVESQGLECTIEFSEKKSSDAVEDCDL